MALPPRSARADPDRRTGDALDHRHVDPTGGRRLPGADDAELDRVEAEVPTESRPPLLDERLTIDENERRPVEVPMTAQAITVCRRRTERRSRRDREAAERQPPRFDLTQTSMPERRRRGSAGTFQGAVMMAHSSPGRHPARRRSAAV
jgi:hypothetical protein